MACHMLIFKKVNFRLSLTLIDTCKLQNVFPYSVPAGLVESGVIYTLLNIMVWTMCSRTSIGQSSSLDVCFVFS